MLETRRGWTCLSWYVTPIFNGVEGGIGFVVDGDWDWDCRAGGDDPDAQHEIGAGCSLSRRGHADDSADYAGDYGADWAGAAHGGDAGIKVGSGV